ncbi:hypothetical protein V8E36_005473 [Tilletia maclaganii]
MVLHQSLRQSRLLHLTALLAPFSMRITAAQTDQSGNHASAVQGPEYSYICPLPPSLTHHFDLRLPHFLVQLGSADVRVGPHVFTGTKFWEVRPDPEGIKAARAAMQASRPGVTTPPAAGLQDGQDEASTAEKTPRSAATAIRNAIPAEGVWAHDPNYKPRPPIIIVEFRENPNMRYVLTLWATAVECTRHLRDPPRPPPPPQPPMKRTRAGANAAPPVPASASPEPHEQFELVLTFGIPALGSAARAHSAALMSAEKRLQERQRKEREARLRREKEIQAAKEAAEKRAAEAAAAAAAEAEALAKVEAETAALAEAQAQAAKEAEAATPAGPTVTEADARPANAEAANEPQIAPTAAPVASEIERGTGEQGDTDVAMATNDMVTDEVPPAPAVAIVEAGGTPVPPELVESKSESPAEPVTVPGSAPAPESQPVPAPAPAPDSLPHPAPQSAPTPQTETASETVPEAAPEAVPEEPFRITTRARRQAAAAQQSGGERREPSEANVASASDQVEDAAPGIPTVQKVRAPTPPPLPVDHPTLGLKNHD